MPALIPVDKTLGALFIGAVLSSMIYGITWLQVYSYYNTYSSKDKWPLKSFVAFLILVDSANLFFGVYPVYHLVVTNFGDYREADIFTPWSQAALALSTVVLESCVQHFYAYRIYRLGWRSPYLPIAISVSSLAEFVVGVLYSVNALQHLRKGGIFRGYFTATLSCKVLCDVLITVGMVYTLLSNRTHVRSTNNTLNLLAIYTINCGTLHLAFAIASVVLFAKYPDANIYTATFFIMVRLSLCAFMSILNSRDHLRETLDGSQGVVVVTLTQTSTTAPPGGVWGTAGRGAGPNMPADPKCLPPVSVPPDTPFSNSVIPFDRDKYPESPYSLDISG